MKRHQTIGDMKDALIAAGVPEKKVNDGWFLADITDAYNAIAKPAVLDYKDAIIATMSGWAMDESEKANVKAMLERLAEDAV